MRRGSLAQRHAVTGVFALVLISLFAVLALVVVLTGTQAYTSVTGRADQNVSLRGTMGYLTEKLRTGDDGGAVCVFEADGVHGISIGQDVDGTRYETRVYAYEGNLCEQFVEAGEPFDASMGDLLIPVKDAVFSLDSRGLAAFTVTFPDGSRRTAHVALRCAPGQEG